MKVKGPYDQLAALLERAIVCAETLEDLVLEREYRAAVRAHARLERMLEQATAAAHQLSPQHLTESVQDLPCRVSAYDDDWPVDRTRPKVYGDDDWDD